LLGRVSPRPAILRNSRLYEVSKFGEDKKQSCNSSGVVECNKMTRDISQAKWMKKAVRAHRTDMVLALIPSKILDVLL
jgi:hypothetical protein